MKGDFILKQIYQVTKEDLLKEIDIEKGLTKEKANIILQEKGEMFLMKMLRKVFSLYLWNSLLIYLLSS